MDSQRVRAPQSRTQTIGPRTYIRKNTSWIRNTRSSETINYIVSAVSSHISAMRIKVKNHGVWGPTFYSRTSSSSSISSGIRGQSLHSTPQQGSLPVITENKNKTCPYQRTVYTYSPCSFFLQGFIHPIGFSKVPLKQFYRAGVSGKKRRIFSASLFPNNHK